MINLARTLGGLLLLLILTACGGGGGSPGTVGGASAPAVVTARATLLLELRGPDNVPTVSVSASGATTLRATLRPVPGFSVANRLVTFTADTTQLSFPQGSTALTDASGVAQVLVTPASLLASGAGSIDASAVVGSNTITGRLDYQLSAANLTLANLNVGAATLAAYGNRAVTVQVNANGVATATPVQVSFSASCGTIEPPVAVTSATGVASATYKADGAQGCGGSNVSITASTAGTAPLLRNLTIAAAPPTNLQFVAASPAVIFLSGSGGPTQSQVRFRVVNATGGALQGVDVRLSLVNSATDVSIDTLGSTAEVVKTTDLAGEVTVPVFSGGVPTPLQVRAALVSNPAIETTSSILTVASGRAAQSRASLSRSVFAPEGWSIDGIVSRFNMAIADRQGNPVPDGTVVNFVTEGGVMVPASCVTAGGTSQCAVELRTQNPRPANGRVTVLAYVQGEEDFVDANFNNRYDLGESFSDLGNAYRDDDESGTYSVGEFSVPRSGSAACTGGPFGLPNTCDGTWGAADVRAVQVVVFASSEVSITPVRRDAELLRVRVADVNGNSPATGSTITATYSGAGSCKVEGPFPKVVANQLTPQVVDVGLSGCSLSDRIRITVTSPSGVATSDSF